MRTVWMALGSGIVLLCFLGTARYGIGEEQAESEGSRHRLSRNVGALAPTPSVGTRPVGARGAALPLTARSLRPSTGYTHSSGHFMLAGVTSSDLGIREEIWRGAPPQGDEPRAVVVAYASDGRPRWAAALQGPGDHEILDVTGFGEDAVLVTGRIEGHAALGGMRSREMHGKLVQAYAAVLDAEGSGRWLEAPIAFPHRWSVGRAATVLTDGRLLVVGELEHDGTMEVFACIYDSEGKRQLMATFVGELGDVLPVPLCAAEGGGFHLARRLPSATGPGRRAVIAHHGPDLRVTWETPLPQAGGLRATCLLSADDGGALVGAYATNREAPEGRAGRRVSLHGVLVRLDDEGRLAWQRRLVATGEEAYVVPLGLLHDQSCACRLVGLAHGEVRSPNAGMRPLHLTNGRFGLACSSDGSPLALSDFSGPTDGVSALQVVGGRWLGLDDTR